MDNYLNFTNVKDVFFFDNDLNQFICAPITKGDIFKNKYLSLIEKKEIYTLINILIRLADNITKYTPS